MDVDAGEADKALWDYDGWRLTVRQDDNGVALTGNEATKPRLADFRRYISAPDGFSKALWAVMDLNRWPLPLREVSGPVTVGLSRTGSP